MSPRPKLTPLSNLLPAKGAAQRPEALPEPVEQVTDLANEQADDVASIQDGKQASAQTTHSARMQAPKHASEHADTTLVSGIMDVAQAAAPEQSRNPANEQPRKQSGTLSSIQSSLLGSDGLDEFKNGPRSAVSFRMTERLQERLREFAHRSRRSKQDILDQAVHELLTREGF